MTIQEEKSIRIGGIEVSTTSIKPVSGNLATVVKAVDIQDITIRNGFRSHHPVIQIIFGAALSLLLTEVLKSIYHWLSHGGVTVE